MLLPFGAWITAFLKGELCLEPGSYATVAVVAPFGTHIEVEPTPQDHTIFLAIRRSSGLMHAEAWIAWTCCLDSLDLLEDWLTPTRALWGPVA